MNTLAVEPGPETRHIHRLLALNLEQGAAGELDAVVQPRDEQEEQTRDQNGGRNHVGVAPDPDEIVVGVAEESQHVRYSGLTWPAAGSARS